MVSQIALCSATTFAHGRRVAVGCTVMRVCVGRHVRSYICGTSCVRDAQSWMGPKVVGILLEGEKYELAARGSSNSLRARSNREEVSVRQRSDELVRVRRTEWPRGVALPVRTPFPL